MSFFDKLFTHKSNNKNDNDLKNSEPLGFRPSTLTISKEHIRFLLFRECDRRGRKLLFDSNAVEKIPLTSTNSNGDEKSQIQNAEKGDFIEVTKTHGYKYKKPPNDISLLGEMMFGSVAMVYKGENSCKIHRIPSPKQLMFTSIIHAPNHSCISLTGETSVESSSASVNKNQKETSSSDSKLYTHKEEIQKYSSTYPYIKKNAHLDKISQCCEFSDVELNLNEDCLSKKNSINIDVENSSSNTRNNDINKLGLVKENRNNLGGPPTEEDLMLNLAQKSSDCELESNSNMDSFLGASLTSIESENVSNISGSSSSLRRRWAQSYATSLDSSVYEGINFPSCKKKAKLGMALLINLNDTENHDLEQFLFNHTIIIDTIMKKLQSTVELAYINNQNFVNLLYSGFLESQQSIYELITSAKCSSPVWITLLDDNNENKETSQSSNNSFKLKNMSENTKLKFMKDFCDVLIKFDTKDTNFFISTLLTAVLTHHLSWVSTIAENDDDFVNNRHQKMADKLGPYNPIWAQLNDLCGLLGSPLKCAKTVITGAENKRCHIVAIIQVLTYFIRCYSIVENVYDVDIESIMGLSEEEIENLYGSKSSCSHKKNNLSLVNTEKMTKESSDKKLVEETKQFNQTVKREIESEDGKKLEACVSSNCNLKRSKSCLAQLKLEDTLTSDKIYPGIEELAKNENLLMEDLGYGRNDKKILVNDLKDKALKKSSIEISHRKNKSHLDIHLSPDEGYDTIGSLKTDDICTKKIEMERQQTCEKQQKDVIFVLGENEELRNLPKKVVITKSDVIEIESEGSENLVKIDENVNKCTNSEIEGRTLKSLCSENKINLEKSELDDVVNHSSHKSKINSLTVPWIVKELEMPRKIKSCTKKPLDVSSVFGGVKKNYNSEQIIQGVLESKNQWQHLLEKDLFLCAHSGILEKNVSEALCILGDVDSWEVLVFSSNASTLDRNTKHKGVRVGMSQLVADMLESFLCLHKINLSPNFCLLHIEKKLHEIYSKSKTVAEVLSSSNICTIDFLTTRLDIEINDVPLLLSVATTHCPHISEKYGLSFT